MRNIKMILLFLMLSSCSSLYKSNTSNAKDSLKNRNVANDTNFRHLNCTLQEGKVSSLRSIGLSGKDNFYDAEGVFGGVVGAISTSSGGSTVVMSQMDNYDKLSDEYYVSLRQNSRQTELTFSYDERGFQAFPGPTPIMIKYKLIIFKDSVENTRTASLEKFNSENHEYQLDGETNSFSCVLR